MPTGIRLLLVILVVATLSIAGTLWFARPKPSEPAPRLIVASPELSPAVSPEPEPVVVSVPKEDEPIVADRVWAQRGVLISEVMGRGRLVAGRELTVSTPTAGRIAAVLVGAGDEVEMAQPLVRLENQELTQQVAISRHRLEAAKEQVKQREAAKRRAEAAVQRAEIDLRGVRELVLSHSATQMEFDRGSQSLMMARAELEEADAALVVSQQLLKAAEASLAAGGAALAKTEIRAPFAGRVLWRQADPGAVTVPGDALLKLAALDGFAVEAQVDVRDVGRVMTNQPVRVVFDVEPGKAVVGRVSQVGREVQAPRNTVAVDVVLEMTPEYWVLGQGAAVYIEAGRVDDAVQVPVQAIAWRDGESGVWVERDRKIAWHPVELGTRGQSFVVVESGLAEDQPVLIVPAQMRSQDIVGRRVQVR